MYLINIPVIIITDIPPVIVVRISFCKGDDDTTC